MSERYTSDVPAIPDSDYVYLRPELQRNIFERALDEPEKMSASVRAMIEDMAEQKRLTVPLEYNHGIELFFESSQAQKFIDQWAVYDDDGRLNMDLTSSKIGIPYSYDMQSTIASGEMTGLPGSGISTEPIEIHLDRTRRLHQATYGHEIGHYFVRVVQGLLKEESWNRQEEEFCNYFGRRMAMPFEQLKDYFTAEKEIDEEAISDMMNRFRMDLGDTITGLMEWGILPPRVAVDSYHGKLPNQDYSQKVNRGTFCLHCMRVGGDYNCPTVDQPTPLFDFTDRAWGAKMPSCLGEDLHKADIMSTLTKYYVANEVQLVLFRPGAEYEVDPNPEDE